MRVEPQPGRRADRWRKARRAIAREQGRGDLPGQLLFPWYVGPLPMEESRAADVPPGGRVFDLRRKGAGR